MSTKAQKNTKEIQVKTTFSSEQRAAFKRFRNKGLTGTSMRFKPLILQLCKETNLPEKVVRSRVHNSQRVKGKKRSKKTYKKRYSYSRGLTGYNIFCQTVGSKSSNATERQKIWGQMWAAISKPDQEVYNERARAINNTPLTELEGDDRVAAIDSSISAMTEHMDRLQQLGHTDGFFIIRDSEGFIRSSCGVGSYVLSSMEIEIQAALGSVSVPDENPVQEISAEDRRGDIRKTLAANIRNMYGKYRGFPGPRKFPYKAYCEGKTDFMVTGLPDGFVLRDPTKLLQHELQTVLNSNLCIIAKESGSTSMDVSSEMDSTNFLPHENGTNSTGVESTSMDASSQIASTNLTSQETDTIRTEEGADVQEESFSTTDHEVSIAEEPSADFVLAPTPAADSLNTSDDGVVSIPHLSGAEALEKAKQMAKAYEAKKSKVGKANRAAEDEGQRLLNSLLGKTVMQLWKMKAKGKKSYNEWYTGTVVTKECGKFAIKFEGDPLLRNLTPKKAESLIVLD